jgi:hypothetical protein
MRIAPSLPLALALVFLACEPDSAKPRQCKQLVDVVGAEDQKLVGPDPIDAEAMTALAEKLETAAQAVGALSLTVPELVSQRDAIQAAWTKAAAAVRLSVVAAEKADIARATQAQTDSASAGRAYTDAVESVNRFCHTD